MFTNYVYCDGRNGVIPKIVKILGYSINPNRMEGLHNIRFIDDALMHTCTFLRFPPKAEDYKGQQVQKMNYDAFIRTMAEMVKKYAPKMLN